MELTLQILEKMFTDLRCGAWRLVPVRVGSKPGWGYRCTSGHTSPMWLGALDGFDPIRTDDAGKGPSWPVPHGDRVDEPVVATLRQPPSISTRLTGTASFPLILHNRPRPCRSP
ncbi:MAG: hypothetical protein EBT09_11765 [Actinobacteria bacterium]|nr:hypothetical protein [Actinomycetota bacterium]